MIGNNWIDYNKQKPDKEGYYLVCRHHLKSIVAEIDYIFITQFIKSGITQDGYFKANGVSHWQPLPESPESPEI